jgi:hypothetical protein
MFQKSLLARFTLPSLGIDYGVDFLLEVMHSPYSSEVETYPLWKDHRYVSVANLLTCNDQIAPDLETYKGKVAPDKECIAYLLELCNDIKKSPTRLARLLIQIAKFEFKISSRYYATDCVVACHDIMTIVQEHYLGDKMQFISHLYELAEVLRRHRDILVSDWDDLCTKNPSTMGQFGSKEDFRIKCTQVINGLTEHHPTTFGVQARRSLVCTRPVIVQDSAIGWLGMREGEMFRPQVSKRR